MSPSFLILCGLAEAALGTIALGTAAIAVEAVLAIAALEALAVTTGTTVAVTTGTTLAALLVRLGGVQRAGSGAQGLGEDLALVDPDLDADAAEGGGSLSEAVVDVGTDGLQGNGALVIVLNARDLAAAETTGAAAFDAWRRRAWRGPWRSSSRGGEKYASQAAGRCSQRRAERSCRDCGPQRC